MKEKKIVFRCNGGENIGWGHVFRCLNLAQWLTLRYKVYFVVNQNRAVHDMLRKRGYTFFEIGVKESEEKAMNTVLSLEPDMVVNDIQNTTFEYMHALKNRGIKIVNFDDTSSHAKMANVLIDANRKERKEKEGSPDFFKHFSPSINIILFSSSMGTLSMRVPINANAGISGISAVHSVVVLPV